VHTPRLCGQLSRAGTLLFSFFLTRGFRTNWFIVVITKLQKFFAQPSGKLPPGTLPALKTPKGTGKAAKFKTNRPLCQYHQPDFKKTRNRDAERNQTLTQLAPSKSKATTNTTQTLTRQQPPRSAHQIPLYSRQKTRTPDVFKISLSYYYQKRKDPKDKRMG
jgi:hypothetical protein